MRYNFACALSVHLNDKQAALDMLESAFAMRLGSVPALRQGRSGP